MPLIGDQTVLVFVPINCNRRIRILTAHPLWRMHKVQAQNNRLLPRVLLDPIRVTQVRLTADQILALMRLQEVQHRPNFLGRLRVCGRITCLRPRQSHRSEDNSKNRRSEQH